MVVTTSTRATFTSGAGTAVTANQQVIVPDWARYVVAAKGHILATQGDPAESGIGVFSHSGASFNNSDWEQFSEVASAKLGAIDEVAYEAKPQWWPGNLPVAPGGNDFQMAYEPLDALANNGECVQDYKWSDMLLGPHQKGLMSRETASSTATGPSLTLTDLAEVVGIGGVYTTSTVAADDPSAARMTITCSNLEVNTSVFHYNYIHTIEATSGVAKTSLTWIDVQISAKKPPPALFTSAITVETALGTAGQYAYGITYTPRSVSRP